MSGKLFFLKKQQTFPVFLLVIFLSIAGFSGSRRTAHAQSMKRKIYAAVLSNKRYTVGRNNPGTGLYVGDENGQQWKNLAFQNMRTFAIDIFPHVNGGLFYTANGNGVIVSQNGGKSWRVTTGWEITEVLQIKALPQNPGVLFIGTAYGAYKSENMGENWQKCSAKFVSALHIDVADGNRLYIGQEDGLMISKDGGVSFRQVKNFQQSVLSFSQDPVNPDRLYLGTEDEGIFISNDRGKNWQPVSGEAAKATVYGITVDPANHNRVFAATYAHGILSSRDGGKKWASSKIGIESIPVHDIALHPDNSKILYAATINSGIYRSLDGGKSWHPFGLNGAQVMEIEVK